MWCVCMALCFQGWVTQACLMSTRSVPGCGKLAPGSEVTKLQYRGLSVRSSPHSGYRPGCGLSELEPLGWGRERERESVRECERETETEIKEIKRDKDMVTKRQRSRKKAEAR